MPGQPPEGGEMNEMTLPSRHRIRISNPGDLGSSALPRATILNLCEWAGKKQFVSLKLEGQSGVRTRDLRHSKQADLTTAIKRFLFMFNSLKGLAQAKIIKKSVILFRVLNMTI